MKKFIGILLIVVLFTQFTPGILADCPLMDNTDLPGSDYKDFDLKTADPNACKKACEEDPNCISCSYVKPGVQGRSARCWLKNTIPTSINNSCCSSWEKNCSPSFEVVGVVVNLQNVSTGFFDGVDLPGSDYKSFDLKADDPLLCSDACLHDSQCVSCTYVKPGVQGSSARCWLKNMVPQEKLSDCCSSWIKGNLTPTPTPT